MTEPRMRKRNPGARTRVDHEREKLRHTPPQPVPFLPAITDPEDPTNTDGSAT